MMDALVRAQERPHLDIAFIRDHEGRTRLETAQARHPWWLARAHAVPGGPAGLISLTPQTSAGALLAGDCIDQRIIAGAGASAIIQSQGAMPVHARRDGEDAESNWRIEVGASAFLEVHCDPLVFFPDAGLVQTIELYAAKDAVLLFADGFVWQPHDATPSLARFASELSVHDAQGATLARERFDIDAESLIFELAASRRDVRALGQVLVIAAPAPELRQALHDTVETLTDAAWAGVTELPNRAGFAVRILATDAIALASVQDMVRASVYLWRWNAAPCERRRGI